MGAIQLEERYFRSGGNSSVRMRADERVGSWNSWMDERLVPSFMRGHGVLRVSLIFIS